VTTLHRVFISAILFSALPAGDSLAGSVIANNVVLRSVQGRSDSGAIYTEMLSYASNNLTIKNNFVRDYGHSGGYGAIGIYLDEGANHVTISGNIVGPPTEGAVPFQNDSGSALTDAGPSNTFTANIVDLGDSGRQFASLNYGYSAYGEAGNVYSGNVIVSNFLGSSQQTSVSGDNGKAYFQNITPASNYTIQNNEYWNYASGGQIFTTGSITSDSNPLHQYPQISGWTYQIAQGSPVFSAPINFPSIVGGWGPPGFVIPSSSNHSDP
jgi:hypothetical protein